MFWLDIFFFVWEINVFVILIEFDLLFIFCFEVCDDDRVNVVVFFDGILSLYNVWFEEIKCFWLIIGNFLMILCVWIVWELYIIFFKILFVFCLFFFLIIVLFFDNDLLVGIDWIKLGGVVVDWKFFVEFLKCKFIFGLNLILVGLLGNSVLGIEWICIEWFFVFLIILGRCLMLWFIDFKMLYGELFFFLFVLVFKREEWLKDELFLGVICKDIDFFILVEINFLFILYFLVLESFVFLFDCVIFKVK